MAGDGDDGVLNPPGGPGRRFYHGHGRPQRRRPLEWSLSTDFRAPDAEDVTWLPPGATPAGADRDQDAAAAADDPAVTGNGPPEPEPPDVDKPFTL